MRNALVLLAVAWFSGCVDGVAEGPTATQERAVAPTPPPSKGPSPTPAEPPMQANTTNQSVPEPRKPEKIGTGTIQLGGPHGRAFLTLAVLGAPGIDGFFFVPPRAGTNVTTVTKDRGGLDYDLDFNFHDADGIWLGGCQTPKKDEVCIVPGRAARGEVAAHRGVHLEVDVFTAPDKEGIPVSRFHASVAASATR